MDRKQKILKLARQLGLIRPRDVEVAGIHREYLLRLYRNGDLVRVGRGLYSLPDAQTSEHFSLAEVTKRVPNAVICLISALEFHHLTTQIAHRVWIAIENKKWEPKFEYPPLEIVRFSGPAFGFGVEEHEVDRITVKIYSPAKTVADAFKFRITKSVWMSLWRLSRKHGEAGKPPWTSCGKPLRCAEWRM